MNNKKFLLSLSTTTAFLLSLGLGMFSNPQIFEVNSNEKIYSITLNSNNKITNTTMSSEFSNGVYTALSNVVTLTGYNVSEYDNGWQTLLPGGYVYNPLTQEEGNNKIKGIKSIRYIGSSNLELHYGYTLDNQSVIYSLEDTLKSNITYEFVNEHPSYIYFKNNSNENIAIDELVITYSCNDEPYPKQNLKILMIGNSFADDTVFYSRRIANSYGINIEIHDAYIAGCTIDQHYNNILTNSTNYSMRSTDENGSWVYVNNKSLDYIVTYKDWDIITFQQASAQVGRVGSYSNLTNLVTEVKNKVKGNPKYYWHQTWAYDNGHSEYEDYFSYFGNDSDTMFIALVDRYQNEVVPTGLFEKTIYNGTAIQNMRTSYMGNTFSRDGKHMSLVHGRYLLASNFISTVYNIDYDLSPLTYKPDGVSSNYQKLVKESITNARKYPNTVTNSRYTTTEVDEYDLTDYTEIDAGLVGCSYWNCTDPSNYKNRNNHINGTSNKYVSSFKFTIDTLPIGSLIFIKEGLGYRPEGWINDSPNYNRVPEEYKRVLEITSDWWNGYQFRAFNIFKAGKQDLSGEYIDEQYAHIFDGFKIYVPNNMLNENIKIKSNNEYRSIDKAAFTSHGLNIDDYVRVHLDPITGFYKCDEHYSLCNKYVDNTAQRFVCTREFESIPEGTVLILDSGYQWRSDCWGERGMTSQRPDNVTTRFYKTPASFMSGYRRRTFNVSRQDGVTMVGQNSVEFINHFRMYMHK